MKNKGLKILLSALLVLCIIMAGALIGKEYIGDNIKEAANQNGVDVVKDTSDTEKKDDNAVDSTAQGTESTQSDAAAEAENAQADTQQPQMSTIVITATGDCTLGNNQEQSYDGSFNSYYDSKGQDYFFGGVRDIFEADDMTLINLECVLSDATERVEKRWNLKGKPGYIGIMTGSSIEACSLGNNHTYDYGQQGLDDTRSVLENAGIVYGFNDQTGIYETADGTRIGIVSASLLSQNGDREAYIQNGIAKLREQGAAIVIACCHWGIEGDHYPNDYQQAAAHRIIDWGADLVVGNHPHVLQGMEVYNGKMICYSLGNFCFGGNKNPSDKNTAIYQQAFTLINGELQIFVLYESQEGKTDWVEQTVPYEGRIECAGAEEGMYHHVYDQLDDISVEVRMDEDGEMRALGIEAALQVRLFVYGEEKLELLEDAYSLDKKCVLQTEEAVVEELLMQNHSKSKIAERLSLPELKDEILQVCHSSADLQMEKMEVQDGGILAEGILHVSFLYVKANDEVPFGVWKGMVPFSAMLECREGSSDMKYDITYAVEQLAVDLAGNDEVEIKAVVAFRSFMRKAEKIQMVTEAALVDYEKEERMNQPGIVGYIVKDGDDLWSLAKTYLMY